MSLCITDNTTLIVLGSPIRKSWSFNAFYQLLQAYRRFIRPSSDIQVKASTLCYISILIRLKLLVILFLVKLRRNKFVEFLVDLTYTIIYLFYKFKKFIISNNVSVIN